MPDLAIYLLRSAAVLAVFTAVYWLTLRRETCFTLNRAFLLAGAGLSLILPFLRVPSPFFTRIVDASALRPLPIEPVAGPLPPSGPGASDILAVVYVAGAALFLLLFAVRLGRLALLAKRCGCVRQRGVRIVLCGHPGESFSFFHFVFLNRSKVPVEDLDRVLTHELAHVRQLHSLDIVFSELLSVIQWFNPFVWPYKGLLRETHEYLADRAVIAQGGGLARYQLLIVEQHVGGRLLELASSFRTSQIKRRIVMLSKQRTKGLARWKPLLILPLAVALVLVFAESRTIVKQDPAQGRTLKQSLPWSQQKLSEEQIKEKAIQVDQMKKKNQDMIAKLKAKLAEAPDAAAKEEIQAALKEQKIEALMISETEGRLKMMQLDLVMSKEADPAKKAVLAKELEKITAETDLLAKKVAEARQALGAPEKTADAKIK